jgi:hypothetical protein
MYFILFFILLYQKSMNVQMEQSFAAPMDFAKTQLVLITVHVIWDMLEMVLFVPVCVFYIILFSLLSVQYLLPELDFFNYTQPTPSSVILNWKFTPGSFPILEYKLTVFYLPNETLDITYQQENATFYNLTEDNKYTFRIYAVDERRNMSALATPIVIKTGTLFLTKTTIFLFILITR